MIATEITRALACLLTAAVLCVGALLLAGCTTWTCGPNHERPGVTCVQR